MCLLKAHVIKSRARPTGFQFPWEIPESKAAAYLEMLLEGDGGVLQCWSRLKMNQTGLKALCKCRHLRSQSSKSGIELKQVEAQISRRCDQQADIITNVDGLCAAYHCFAAESAELTVYEPP